VSPDASGAALGAVLFDMDGLLVDSEPLWFQVESAVMAELGGSWTHSDQAACLGGTLPTTAAYLVQRSGSDRPLAAIQQQLLTGMAELLGSAVPWRPGARELLAELNRAGVPCALVSSSYRRLVDAVLAGVRGADGSAAFAATVAGDEVRRLKPAPDPYLRAAQLLDVPPRDCVVLEDSPTGVAAGEAAGCVVVAVPSLVDIEATPRRPVVRSLAELDLAYLRTLPPAAAVPERGARTADVNCPQGVA